MRHILALVALLLVLTVAAMGQVGVNTPVLSFTNSTSVVDQHGNLIILDTVYSLTAGISGTTTVGSTGSGSSSGTVNIPVPPIPIRQVTPSTRIIVVPGGTGQPISKQYAAAMQVVGTGKWALYAAANAYSTSNNQLVLGPRKLIAIDAGVSGTALPTDFSGFLNTDLNAGDVKLNPSTGSGPDTIFNVEADGFPIGILSSLPPVGAPVKVRTARTITFDGTRFASTDVVLPQ